MSNDKPNVQTATSGLWAARMAHANAIEGNPLTPAEQALIDKLVADGKSAADAVQMIIDAARKAKEEAPETAAPHREAATVAE